MSSSGSNHYSIPDDGTEFATTNLIDKGPTISLEFVNNYVTKSQPAQFKVTASSKLASNATILVDVSGINCIPGAAPTQTIILKGESEGTLDVTTISDQSVPECMITATLSVDARYKVHETKYTGTVRVGNDIVYTVSIARPNPINEGQDAVFTITTSPKPETAIEIDVNISQVGNYILWNVPRTISTSITSSDTELTIKTKIDSMDERPGSITVEIMEGDGYRPGSPNSATINISDSDDSDNSSLSRTSIADSAVTAILNALPSPNLNSVNQPNPIHGESRQQSPSSMVSQIQPQLSIVAEQPVIYEGASAGFIIHADIPIQSDLIVPIEVKADTNLYAGDFEKNLNIRVGQRSIQFSLQTEDDDVPEHNESVQVVLKEGNGYSVSEFPNNSTLVTINDLEDHNRVKENMSDAYNEVMPFMLNTIGSKSLETLTTRSKLAFTNNKSPKFELNGISELPEIITQLGMTTNQDSQSRAEMIRNSSFSIGFQPDSILTNNVTVWGFNEHEEISSSTTNRSRTWDGEYTTHQLGFESVFSQNILAGVTASFSKTQIEYGVSDDIQLELDGTHFQSYIGYVPIDQKSQFQIATGYGKLNSDIKHTSQIGGTIESDYITFAVAGQKNIFGIGNTNEIGSFELAMKGQYWNAQIINVNGRYFHKNKEINRHELLLAPEGIYRVVLPNSAEVSNVTSIGVGSNFMSASSDYLMDYRDYLSFTHPIGYSVIADGQISTDRSNQISGMSLTTQLQN